MMAASSPLLSAKTRKRGAPPQFDNLARVYRWMEYLSFGPALSRCRTEFLADLAHCRNALVIGDGDGRFTARLLEANPAIRVDAIDASPAMLRALVRRAGRNAPRVRAEVADARAWYPADAEPFDLVVTHFFLDCLTTAEVRALAGRIQSAAAPEAKWVVSEFKVPHSRIGRLVARPLVAALYRAFGILTGLKVRSLPAYDTALSEAGFRLVHRRARLCGLLVSELWTIG
jgi:trans-aconitate methyltransferase